MTRVRWLPAAARDEAGAIWAEIDADRTDCRACSSWTWTRTWLAHFGADVPHRFAVAEEDGRPAGIVLVCHAPRRPGRPRTIHLGTAGQPGAGVYVEDNRIAARPGRRAAVGTAVAEGLLGFPGWDRLALDGFAAVDAAAVLPGTGHVRGRVEPSPFVDLAAARAAGHAGDVLGVLRPGPRKRVRRSLRAYGLLHDDWASDATAARRLLDELVVLHQARWTAAGQPGAFADPRVLGFHRDLVASLTPGEDVILFGVREDDGTPVGLLYLLADAGSALFYQGGLSTVLDNKRKPGLVTHARCLQACSDRGLDRYDLLAGEARYKRELATGERPLVWAASDRPGLRTDLDRARRGAKVAARRLRARSAT